MGTDFDQFLNRDRFAQVRRNTAGLDFHGKIVENEIKLFKINPAERPRYLGLLFEALKTLKPTSVEAERAFSAMGFFFAIGKLKLCIRLYFIHF